MYVEECMCMWCIINPKTPRTPIIIKAAQTWHDSSPAPTLNWTTNKTWTVLYGHDMIWYGMYDMYDQTCARDCARVPPVNFCGAGIPAFRFDWGFGRESVYLFCIRIYSKQTGILDRRGGKRTWQMPWKAPSCSWLSGCRWMNQQSRQWRGRYPAPSSIRINAFCRTIPQYAWWLRGDGPIHQRFIVSFGSVGMWLGWHTVIG